MKFILLNFTLGTLSRLANSEASPNKNDSFGPIDPTKNVISFAIRINSRPFGYSGVEIIIRQATTPH